MNPLLLRLVMLAASLVFAVSAVANIPGGGTGTGANVTLTDSGTTVTIGNGIVSLVCTKSSGQITTINYTFNNTGSSQTLNLISGNSSGGKLYWESSNNQGLTFTYTLIADPASNGGNYAEIAVSTASQTNSVLEVHYSLTRGATGFYVTAIWYHRSTDGASSMGECRDNIYAGSIFNWMSVDAQRNRVMEVSGGSSIGVQGAPVECYLWTNGIYAGQYDDKYKYSADLGVDHVWGWSSVGTGGKNVGLWNISASSEYYNGGPLKRELMEHIGTTILNMLNGEHYGMGSDGSWAANEVWTKVDGPYFIYCNNITNTITATNLAAQALYNDALAQGIAEAGAWPYAWFTNANYSLAANRGIVAGKIVINDSGNPNASAANLWVGLIQQPANSGYDFQQWIKPYQFWTKTDANGNFSVSNAIAGANYTLYAYGPGAPAMFMSQAQTGGSPPVLFDLPVTPFAVSVPAGATTNLGNVIWKPARVGATVFEIGYPNRTSDKFRHGDDWWVGDIGPSKTAPSPVWSKWLEYQFDFPNGVNYVVGQNRWSTDWNFCQPVVTDSQGNYNSSSSTITFNLATAPTNGATASLYLGLSSDYYSAIIVNVNGTILTSSSTITGSPTTNIPSTGYYPGYSASDTTIREGNQAAASDERINFPASQLHAGVNTINIGIRQIGGSYFADHAMYDYIRLEMTGYVPPAPASALAYAGNNGNLVCWPVVPGATSYNVLRSTNGTSGFVSVTNGVTGSVCGSGAVNATWLDLTAGNGTNYYYVVKSVNPTGSSTNSPTSSGVTPSAAISTSAPVAPTGLTVGSVAHQSVTLNWSATSGANYYSVYRSTLANSGGGSSNVLSTILLNNAVTNTTYTDVSPTDGSIYSYVVTATGAGGISPNSAFAVGVPLPTTLSSVPSSLTASFVYSTTTNITLNWTAVPGAVGYVIARATSFAGPFVYLQTVTETTYTDTGLNPAVIYYYRVDAMNAAAVTGNNTDSVNSQQSFPTNLIAVATNEQITLSWPVTTGASSYTLKRGTGVGAETFTVVTGYTGTTYTDTNLVNGTTYYYVVTATGAGGPSGNSPEVSATPLAIGNGIWISATNGNWSDTNNWISSSIAAGSGNIADFSTLSLPTNLIVTLDSPRTISTLIFGDTTSAYNWALTGTNTLTLGASPNINVENQTATISAPLAGLAGLTKTGLGALTLNVSNSFTGGVTVNVGSLALDFTVSPANNLIAAANILTLGGSALQIIGNSSAASSQTFSATTLSAGESVINAAPASGTNNPTVSLGAISTTVNAGGLVEFIGPATTGSGGASVAATANITTTTAGASGLIANYALLGTVGLYDYAATTSSASPYTIVGASQVAGFYTTYAGGNAGPTGGNVDLTGGTAIGWSGIPYLQSLRFNTGLGANQSVNNNSSYTTLQAADIFVTPNVGAYNVTFNISNLRPNTTGNGPQMVWQNNLTGELIVNSIIQRPNHSTTSYDDAYDQGGPGTVVLNNTGNNYTLQSYLNGGVTLIAGNGSLGAAANGAAVNLNGGTLAANGTFALDNAGANLRPINLLGNGGGLAATAGNTLTVDGVVGSAANTGLLTIGIPASSANGNVAGRLPGTGTGTANSAINATGTVVLTNANYFTGGTILQSGTLNINGINALGGANYGGLIFNGGTLQYATNFSGSNGSSDLTVAPVTLAVGGGTIDLNGNSVTYAGSLGNNGNGALLVKSSLTTGILILQGANLYAGNTIVTNATVFANNSSGSATGTGNVTVQNGGTLAGTGAVGGSVNVTIGGTLAPGNPLDPLNLNNLTLAAGSKTLMQVQHAPFINDAVIVAGTLTEGGTLIVTNIGGALVVGDTFQLFSTANYAGAFNNFVLPALASTNLVWNTNLLTVNGTLSVAAYAPPVIGQINISGTNLDISGTGGIPGWNYYVLTATNLTAPIWKFIATNQFDVDGNFDFNSTLPAALPQQFYRLQLP